MRDLSHCRHSGEGAPLHSAKALATLVVADDERTGVNIIARACEEPVRQISGNAGHEGSIIVQKIRQNNEFNYGFNAATGDYQDLVAAGVIDPAKVTRSAMQNASSISGLMLTTEAMICEIPEKKAAPAPGGEHGPGGMDY